MPRQSVTLTEKNNSWLNAHIEKIGDYANKSELINEKLSKAEKSNFVLQSPDEILAEFKTGLIK